MRAGLRNSNAFLLRHLQGDELTQTVYDLMMDVLPPVKLAVSLSGAQCHNHYAKNCQEPCKMRVCDEKERSEDARKVLVIDDRLYCAKEPLLVCGQSVRYLREHNRDVGRAYRYAAMRDSCTTFPAGDRLYKYRVSCGSVIEMEDDRTHGNRTLYKVSDGNNRLGPHLIQVLMTERALREANCHVFDAFAGSPGIAVPTVCVCLTIYHLVCTTRKAAKIRKSQACLRSARHCAACSRFSAQGSVFVAARVAGHHDGKVLREDRPHQLDGSHGLEWIMDICVVADVRCVCLCLAFTNLVISNSAKLKRALPKLKRSSLCMDGTYPSLKHVRATKDYRYFAGMGAKHTINPATFVLNADADADDDADEEREEDEKMSGCGRNAATELDADSICDQHAERARGAALSVCMLIISDEYEFVHSVIPINGMYAVKFQEIACYIFVWKQALVNRSISV